jgi:1-pyrroline-5-carboxylate dehydrogenase
MPNKFKITYSALNADLSLIHKAFDEEVLKMRSELGREYPSIIGGQEIKSGNLNIKTNPANTSEVIAKYHVATTAHVDEAYAIAKKAQKTWGATPYLERVAITQRAADIIRDRKMRIAVLMTLEVGKNRMEALGDAEESADLLSYYAESMVNNSGYSQPLGKLSPNEDTRDVLRPYGVFAVIGPFNFPMALGAGMSSAAILGGNAVIYKPSDDAPGTAHELYLAYRDAGLPEGIFQVVYGKGPAVGEALTHHASCDGVAFTGSKNVGMQIVKAMHSGPYAKPALVELGGKNAAFICASADLDKAASGSMRSAFGLSGQKCSALSRLYVHESVYSTFMEKFIAQTRGIKIGDPVKQENFMGPVITAASVERHLKAIEDARAIGKIVFGGNDLRQQAEFSKGHFAEPTIVEVPRDARHFKDEFFAPFVAVTKFSNLAEAIDHANSADYGLTGGIFSGDRKEIDYFLDHYEAGVLYANRATGATTGAWPGVQSFTGWKGSGGGSGKGGCGPYYVSQFMREQSRTIMG